MKNYEIIVYGRGGQGCKTTAELITQAAFKNGSFVQSFPEFGPERSGAPVSAFVRISDEPIKTHQSVFEADCVLILDDTLLESDDLKECIRKSYRENSFLLINSKKSVDDFEKFFPDFEVFVTDASGLSEEIIGESRSNVVILGKFAQISKIVSVGNISKVFEDKYLEKIGEERTNKNLQAIKDGAKI